MPSKKQASILLILILLAACSGGPPESRSPEAMEIIRLQITPSLSPWLAEISACAEGIPDFGIYTEILPLKEFNLADTDIQFCLGEAADRDPYMAVMGWETLVVIAGSEFPLPSLSQTSLQAVFSGSTRTWDGIPEASQTLPDPDKPITVLSYPREHELRNLFEQFYLEDQEITPDAISVSLMETLKAHLEENPFAISYALESQINHSIQVLKISGDENIKIKLPVLAITSREPEGALRQLLLCTQQAQGIQ